MRAPQRILAASAVFLGGIVLLFAPDEVGPLPGLLEPGADPLGVERFASALFAVEFMDWMGRGALHAAGFAWILVAARPRARTDGGP